MKRKFLMVFQLFVTLLAFTTILVSCKEFYEKKFTKDGFGYYRLVNNEAAIVEFPAKEVAEIPKTIGSLSVTQLGYEDVYYYPTVLRTVKGNLTKKLIISQTLRIVEGTVDNLVFEVLIINNWYLEFGEQPNFGYFNNILEYFNPLGREVSLGLMRTGKDSSLKLYNSNRKFDVVYLPDNISVIEPGVFDYFNGTIYTSFGKNETPNGWKENWYSNGNVEWNFSDRLYLFDLNGGNNLKILGNNTNFLLFPRDELIPRPANPTKDGYVFKGWFLQKQDPNESYDEFDFFKILENRNQCVTLYAHWI